MSSISKALLALGLTVAMAPAAMAESRTFVLTPASEVRYKGHHPAHDWEGVSKALKGQITLDSEHVTTPFTVQVPVRSFSSGNRNRDTNALSIIEAERFPNAILTVRQLEVANRKATGSTATGQLKLGGTLTFHGVERPVAIVLDGKLDGNHFQAAGSFPIQLGEYQIKRPALLFVPIDDTIMVTVTLDAVAK